MLSLNSTCLDSMSNDSRLGIVKERFCAPPMNSGVFEKPTRGFFGFVRVNECTSVCKQVCMRVWRPEVNLTLSAIHLF